MEPKVDMYFEVEGISACCKSGISVSEIPKCIVELIQNVGDFYSTPEELLECVQIKPHAKREEKIAEPIAVV